jgi:hypothetical protein
MPNIITGHNDVLIVLGATNGGWCVYAGDPDKTASEILETAPAAAVSDDEGLIEWFGEQLSLPAPELQARPPNPGPEAKPAEHGAPPVAPPTPGEFEDALQLSAIREALEPFATFARQTRCERSSYFALRVLEGQEGYAEVSMGDLHNLLSAAGMFTDEMQAPQPPNPGPATAAGDTPPSSAATNSADSERVQMLDVGDGDDDGDDDSVDF